MASLPKTKRDAANALRRTIRGIEEAASPEQPRLPLGVSRIDRALPGGGLRLGCIHEVAGDEAATGFCAALLALALAAGAPGGKILWLARGDDLYAPGLVRYGIEAGQLLVVSGLRRQEDMLWAMEEALRCRAVRGVGSGGRDGRGGRGGRGRPGGGAAPDAGGRGDRGAGTGVVAPRRGAAAGWGGVRAAVSRWRVTGAPSGHGGSDGPETRWRVELLHCRGGRPAEWIVGWRDGGWKALPPSDAAGEPGMRRAG